MVASNAVSSAPLSSPSCTAFAVSTVSAPVMRSEIASLVGSSVIPWSAATDSVIASDRAARSSICARVASWIVHAKADSSCPAVSQSRTARRVLRLGVRGCLVFGLVLGRGLLLTGGTPRTGHLLRGCDTCNAGGGRCCGMSQGRGFFLVCAPARVPVYLGVEIGT